MTCIVVFAWLLRGFYFRVHLFLTSSFHIRSISLLAVFYLNIFALSSVSSSTLQDGWAGACACGLFGVAVADGRMCVGNDKCGKPWALCPVPQSGNDPGGRRRANNPLPRGPVLIDSQLTPRRPSSSFKATTNPTSPVSFPFPRHPSHRPPHAHRRRRRPPHTAHHQHPPSHP